MTAWEPVPYVGADVVAAVLSRVESDPDLTALVAGSGERITYRRLLERARLAAPELAAADQGRGVVVRSDHGVGGAVAVLAAAIAGVRLALVDLGDPIERRAAIVELLGLPVLDADRFPTSGAATRFDGIHSGFPDVIAVTSGSTSAPKIAVLPVKRWASETERIERVHRRAQLVVAGVGSYAYLSLVCASLNSGGTGVLVDPHSESTADLANLLRSENVTFFGVTPTLVHSLARGCRTLPELRHLRLRGERVTGSDLAAAHQLGPNAEIRHIYASTEAGLIASYLWRPGDPITDGVLPLRDVPADCDLAIVDAEGDVVPGVGPEPGELVVRTESMISEYVGGPGVHDLFVVDGGTRWLRTGDLAVAGPDGGIRVLGRVGRRVKIAGMFVDLDEVAVAFEHEPEVAQAAVTSFDDGRQLRLVAHLVPAGGRTIDPVAIRARLASRHPVHMVPSLVRVLDDPPRNAAGKLDHLALARWRPEAVVEEAATWIGLAADPMEAAVLAVVSELAGRPVRLDEDLVNAGFTSLEWVELVERLRSDVGADLEVVHLFSRPTVRGIASLAGSTSPLVPLGAGPVEPPVFWALLGLAAQEAVPLARAAAGRTVWVPVPSGFARPGRPAFTVDEIVGDMVGAIRTTIPGSPLVVAGYSTGCHFARAVAARLLELGQQVPLLVLLDPLVDRRDLVGRLRREVRYRLDRRDLRRGVQTAEARHRSLFRLQVRQTLRSAPASFDGPTLLVRSEQYRDLPVPSGLGGSVRVEVVPGGHRDVILHGPTLAALIDESVGR
ncbi:MAG: AMP-binding protein [Ilumatobacteraceae bacterium]